MPLKVFRPFHSSPISHSNSSDTVQEILLACARPLRNPMIRAKIRSLVNGSVDVEELIAQAGKHRVLPMLYAHLQALGDDPVMQELSGKVAPHFHAQVLSNFRLTQRLPPLLTLLDDNGIPHIVWKGPALALMAYGDLRLRPFTDLDLIVPETHIDQARDLLCANGYRPLNRMTKTQEARHRRTFHAYTLLPEKGQGAIDLHWRITQHYVPVQIDMAGLWRRLETQKIEGISIRSLPPEDTLFLLCVHGTVHRWAELGWLSDVACLVDRFPQLDWEWVLEQSRRVYSERMVLLGLSLCQELLGTELPGWVQDRILAVPLVKELTSKVKVRLWNEPVTQWQRMMYYGLAAQTLSRASDRARFWWRTAGWVMGPRLKRKTKRWLRGGHI